MIGSPPVTPEQAASLEASAQSTGAFTGVGAAVLPCQEWTLRVTVKSTVPYHPEGRVEVFAKITSGGHGNQTERTQMLGETSPPVEIKGSGSLKWSLSGSADKWESAGSTSVSVRPRAEPFTAQVQIKPKKTWAIVKVVDAKNDALVPGFAVGLKLGESSKAGRTVRDKPAVFEELETALRAGPFSLNVPARQFDLASLEHEELWELVSITSA